MRSAFGSAAEARLQMDLLFSSELLVKCNYLVFVRAVKKMDSDQVVMAARATALAPWSQD